MMMNDDDGGLCDPHEPIFREPQRVQLTSEVCKQLGDRALSAVERKRCEE